MEQINDTHFHALVQRRMEELETVELYNQRRDNPGKVARLSRQTIVDIVRQMWLGLPHNRLSATGYRQVGPCLPPGEGVNSLYHALQPFWEKLDGDKLRREAEEQVQDFWRNGSICAWSDAQTLIENHSPHRAVEEGLEGIAWDVDSDGGSGDSNGDDDDSGGPLGGGLGDASAAGTSGAAGAAGAAGAGGTAGETVEASSDSKDIAWGSICTEDAFLEALSVVESVAKKTQDDKKKEEEIVRGEKSQ